MVASQYALTALPDEVDDYIMRIYGPDNKVLVTIGSPTSCFMGGPRQFCVWEGDGLKPNTDEEADALYTFKLCRAHLDDPAEVTEKFQAAVQQGYQLALKVLLSK